MTIIPRRVLIVYGYFSANCIRFVRPLSLSSSSSSSSSSSLRRPIIVMPNKNNLRNQFHKKKKKKADKDISIVGPDFIQILKGCTHDKQVTLVLCGESHEDAMDVTRRGGRFSPKEGWIDLNHDEVFSDLDYNDAAINVFATNKKSLPFQKAKEWGKQKVEKSDVWGKIVLLWVEDGGGGKVSKGKIFLLSIVAGDDDEKEDSQDEKDCDHYINPHSTDIKRILPTPVKEWILKTNNSSREIKTSEWGDLDLQAFHLNRRRLTSEEIDTQELDQIIQQRKETLRKTDNIWTWDDWFAYVRKQQQELKAIDVHLVLEASVPPWEFKLHRPTVHDDIHMPPAADCIRSVEEDEEGDIEDDYDPSSDGIGSYLDFTYRRFMEERILETEGNVLDPSWLHCVDMRDLGCVAACHSKSVQNMWKDLLTTEEADVLLSAIDDDSKKPNNSFLKLEPDSSGKNIKFVPETRMNPERLYLQYLRRDGKLLLEDNYDEESDDDNDADNGYFTYPSFEGFFGQNTDYLYYSKHIKLNYSPFLANCVQSLTIWEKFFTDLFLGGTIPDALSLLHLESNKQYTYVRSPIQMSPNSLNEYRHRDDGEHYITYPFFPSLFFLSAQESSPPRTWSSNLFAKLCDQGDNDSKRIATIAKHWTLQKIQQFSLDPKGADDLDCGGEWFEAYLYAVHKDIYDDIDTSDSTELLKKNKMKSITCGRKYNIGELKIPSCLDGFDDILECFQDPSPIITSRVEVMAKILIDIWMSCLVDFSTVLKIADVISQTKKDKVMIVCYMGSAHTKAVADFYVRHLGFEKKAFLGKVDWEEDERRSLLLPKSLWDCAE